MWCPVVAPRKPPQAPRKPPHAPRSSQEALQPAASEPGPSTPLPAKRSKRTKADQAAEPNKGKGKDAKAKPAPQPGRWLDRDCNAALNMQLTGESRWRPLELCYWPEQGKLPAKGKEYPGLGYKRLRDKPPKAQQQPAVAQWLDRDTNRCLNFQRIGESMQRPLELCSYEDLMALPPIGKAYQQGYKRVNDRLPMGRQRLHRAAEYRWGIDGRAGNNAQGLVVYTGCQPYKSTKLLVLMRCPVVYGIGVSPVWGW
ncbi:hypothetical protein QJQ45_027653 [Haematococcus lacustris]|nr:hypothetical protein QJQ45_027653 [Haematococcus lacustris]